MGWVKLSNFYYLGLLTGAVRFISVYANPNSMCTLDPDVSAYVMSSERLFHSELIYEYIVYQNSEWAVIGISYRQCFYLVETENMFEVRVRFMGTYKLISVSCVSRVRLTFLLSCISLLLIFERALFHKPIRRTLGLVWMNISYSCDKF